MRPLNIGIGYADRCVGSNSLWRKFSVAGHRRTGDGQIFLTEINTSDLSMQVFYHLQHTLD